MHERLGHDDENPRNRPPAATNVVWFLVTVILCDDHDTQTYSLCRRPVDCSVRSVCPLTTSSFLGSASHKLDFAWKQIFDLWT